MTKMIVITGLDGSGKSTFHRELETRFGSQSETLRLPTMDSEKFKDDPILFECCKMINELGERSDKEEQPGMKIIAMFSAVALFNDLFNCLGKRNVKVIFCERHPLVDTMIYAKAYLKVMSPSNLPLEIAMEIDERYDLLLSEVSRILKVDFITSNSLKSHALLAFLYDWFSKTSNLVPEKLFKLFEMKKPDEVYFLDAPAEVLFERIEERENREYHENVEALKQMRSNYHEFLKKFESGFGIIDATSKEAPDALFERLKKIYF